MSAPSARKSGRQVENKHDKVPGPKATILNSIEVSKEIFYRVRLKGLNESLKMIRYLTAKMVYEEISSLSDKELMIFIEAWDKISNSKDLNFRRRNIIELINLNRYQSLIIKARSVRANIHIVLNRIFEQFGKSDLISKHAYFGLKKTFSLKSFVHRMNIRLKKTPRPQSRIGVGYRDQGTCRVPSTDASPSWQEVASSLVSIAVTHYLEETFDGFYESSYRSLGMAV
jgi:hypothetical protein